MSESGKEPVFTSLTPVMLANDNFVETQEDTLVKEFIKNESINVSKTKPIEVTSENVGQIYNTMSSETQVSQIQCAQAGQQHSSLLSVDCMVGFARSVPKDVFVAQILKDLSGDRELLDTARCDILNCIKDAIDCPFTPEQRSRNLFKIAQGNVLKISLQLTFIVSHWFLVVLTGICGM